MIRACLIYPLLLLTNPACIKNTVNIEFTGNKRGITVILSKLNVKRGEPFYASVNVPDSNSSVKWTIKPSDSTQIIPAGKQATIYIALSGSYRITANFYSPADTVNAYDSSNSTIIVNDSIYTAPPSNSGIDTISISGDQITLKPITFSDTGLVIMANTTRLYNCTSYIQGFEILPGPPGPTSTITLDFNSAWIEDIPGNCQGALNTAYGIVGFNTFFENGIHPFKANLNQVNYVGSLTVTDTAYTFAWNYTSGITISPLHIKRN